MLFNKQMQIRKQSQSHARTYLRQEVAFQSRSSRAQMASPFRQELQSLQEEVFVMYNPFAAVF